MSNRSITVRAPSNIALVKYMGKKETGFQLPANSSVSLTLNQLATWVTVQRDEAGNSVSWEASQNGTKRDFGLLGLPPSVSLSPTPLSAAAIARMSQHVERIHPLLQKDFFPKWGLTCPSPHHVGLSFCSANTFPMSSGIASSASSFAAVTLATALALVDPLDVFERMWPQKLFKQQLAQLSRLGSGSSCRSFEGPWVAWENELSFQVDSLVPEFVDFILLVSQVPKKVSSSEAHAQVRTSPLWHGRVERAGHRWELVCNALSRGDVSLLAQVAWAEAWEMHSLFHTAQPPFSYWQPDTLKILQKLAPWISRENAPIVTLDAGPNVHVLVARSQRDFWKNQLLQFFPDLPLLEDGQGAGPEWIVHSAEPAVGLSGRL